MFHYLSCLYLLDRWDWINMKIFWIIVSGRPDITCYLVRARLLKSLTTLQIVLPEMFLTKDQLHSAVIYSHLYYQIAILHDVFGSMIFPNRYKSFSQLFELLNNLHAKIQNWYINIKHQRHYITNLLTTNRTSKYFQKPNGKKSIKFTLFLFTKKWLTKINLSFLNKQYLKFAKQY